MGWLLHQCTTGVWSVSVVVTLEWGLQNLDGVGSYIDVLSMYHQCSWLLHWYKCMPWILALTLMYDQCTTNGVGSYIGIKITKISMVLALTLMHGQCTTDRVGSYIGIKITKTLIILALTLVYGQCTTDGVGSYIGTNTTKTLMVLALTLVHH